MQTLPKTDVPQPTPPSPPKKPPWHRRTVRLNGQLFLLSLAIGGMALLWLLVRPSGQPQTSAAQVATATVSVQSQLVTKNAVSALDKKPQTILFTTRDEYGTVIYQAQLDNQTDQILDIKQIDFPVSPDIRIYGLYLAPIGKKVAIHWNQANTSYISILDIPSQKVTHLLGEPLGWHQGAIFLDWHPDGQQVLVFGFPGSDLDGSAWIVNILTHKYYGTPIKQKDSRPKITDANFSPDGDSIVYAQQDCPSCDDNQIWRVNVDGSNHKLLFDNSSPAFGADALSWSPNGNYITFIHWQRYPASGTMGDLYIMNADGTSQRLLTSAMVDFYDRFQPQWSTDSQHILFVKRDSHLKQHDNLYRATLSNDNITQITNLQNDLMFRPKWRFSDTQVTFLAQSNTNVEFHAISVTNSHHSSKTEHVTRFKFKKTRALKLDSLSDLILLDF